jgi:hypothetical protein
VSSDWERWAASYLGGGSTPGLSVSIKDNLSQGYLYDIALRMLVKRSRLGKLQNGYHREAIA